MRLDRLTPAHVRRAVRIYTELAWPEGCGAEPRQPLDVLEVRARLAEAFKLEEAASARAARGGSQTTKRVLVVAQNADFRSRIRDELSSASPRVEVLTAQTGADALLVAQAAPPKHVILSLAVPDEVVSTLAFSPTTIVMILVGAVIAGLLAAIYPARKAAKMDVLEAIATE